MPNKFYLPTEHQIMIDIINYLRYKKFYCIRLNAGSYKTDKGFIRGVEAGTPDLMAFKPCKHNKLDNVELLFIEVKRSGKTATSLQLAKMRELEDHGAICIVASSIEELEEKM